MISLIGESIGRYHILEQLGEGGMATVYKAYDTRLERNVAFKVLRTDQFIPAQLQMVLQRFEREAKALAKLTHPNIVHVLDFGKNEDAPYLVMEYLPGGTLKQKLGQAILWSEAVKRLLPIAQCLAYAHQHGIIHRDVKPANILINENGAPVLTDFGIAKLLEVTDGQTLTGSGVGLGTPEYMAPEQGIGAKTIDARADIYALGIVLYEMITGRKPYIADTPMAVVIKQINDPLPRAIDYVPDLPENVEYVLIKALAKKPEDRYQSMDEFVQALEKLLQEQIPVTGVSMEKKIEVVTPVKEVKPPQQWRQSRWIAVGVIVLGFVAGGIWLTFGSNKGIPEIVVSATPSKERTLTPSQTPLTTNTYSPTISEKPFDLIGIWKSDNVHAPDNSWNISDSVYFEFTNTKQFVYHGVEAFSSNRPTDEASIVYLNINDATLIKKLIYVPDQPELLGKFQKWTWRFSNGNVLFMIYSLVDSQDLALNDDTITALATGAKVQQSQTETSVITATPIPAWVTNFAEPILAAIKDRTPDFQDDFSVDTNRWYLISLGTTEDAWKEIIKINQGNMQLNKGYGISNYYFINKPDIVLQVDVLLPIASNVDVTLTANSFEDSPDTIQLNSNNQWSVFHQHTLIASGQFKVIDQKAQIMIIVKGYRAAFYVNGIPVAYLENPRLLDDTKNQRLFSCDATCYFDNVKVWNLDNIPHLP